MRTTLTSVVFACFAVPVHAADFAVCDPAGTQLEMTACAVDEFEKADNELNTLYAEVLKSGASDENFVVKVQEAQEAWIAYRDAELEAWFSCKDPNPRVCWGSMYPLSYMSRKTHLTRRRTEELRRLLDEWFPN